MKMLGQPSLLELIINMEAKSYSCLIVDDNPQCISVLQNLLQKYFKEIDIIGMAHSVSQAVDAIHEKDPDIVFLDVEMPSENGIALFDYLESPRFKTIFTTAYEDFAAQAFRLKSLDYLLKPIKPSELKEAIVKVKESMVSVQDASLHILPSLSQSDKITFTAVDSIEIFTIGDILYCKAENNYTMVNGKRKKSLVSKTLGHYEDLLLPYGFFRINRSYLINLTYIERVNKTTSEVVMQGDVVLQISGRRKKDLLDVLSGYVE